MYLQKKKMLLISFFSDDNRPTRGSGSGHIMVHSVHQDKASGLTHVSMAGLRDPVYTNDGRTCESDCGVVEKSLKVGYGIRFFGHFCRIT